MNSRVRKALKWLLLALVLYVVSYGPVDGYYRDQRSNGDPWAQALYAPIIWLSDKVPPLGLPFAVYGMLWQLVWMLLSIFPYSLKKLFE